MALLDVVGTGQEHVTDLREELDKVRDALDRTDAVLGVADDALLKAESAIATSRRWGPTLAVVVGVAVLAGVAVVVWRRRRSADGEMPA